MDDVVSLLGVLTGADVSNEIRNVGGRRSGERSRDAVP